MRAEAAIPEAGASCGIRAGLAIRKETASARADHSIFTRRPYDCPPLEDWENGGRGLSQDHPEMHDLGVEHLHDFSDDAHGVWIDGLSQRAESPGGTPKRVVSRRCLGGRVRRAGHKSYVDAPTPKRRSQVLHHHLGTASQAGIVVQEEDSPNRREYRRAHTPGSTGTM